MDYKKIKQIEDRIAKNKKKLSEEKNTKKRTILGLNISIDELKRKLEAYK